MAITLNAPPDRLGATRAGEEDTRGLDFTAALPAGDSLVSATVTVTRRDGVTIGAGDMTITPAGAPAPWLTANSLGVAAMVVNWWHSTGLTIAGTDLAPTPVDYKVTVSANTLKSRTPFIRDAYVAAVPGLG